MGQFVKSYKQKTIFPRSRQVGRYAITLHSDLVCNIQFDGPKQNKTKQRFPWCEDICAEMNLLLASNYAFLVSVLIGRSVYHLVCLGRAPFFARLKTSSQRWTGHANSIRREGLLQNSISIFPRIINFNIGSDKTRMFCQ